jgi:PhnB protein
MTPAPQIYLAFNGDCEAAFRFYEQRLGATSTRMFPYANSPMAADVPPGWEAKIMHGSITVGGVLVLGADVPPARYERPKGFRIFLEVDDPAETERLFHALAENATIEMPLQQTFWSLRFGVLTDQFGIPWTLSCAQMPAT